MDGLFSKERNSVPKKVTLLPPNSVGNSDYHSTSTLDKLISPLPSACTLVAPHC